MQLDPYKGKIRCLKCGYPLLGLPPVHSCPECGLSYDPYSRMYRVRRRRMEAFNFFVPTAIMLVVLALVRNLLLFWALVFPSYVVYVIYSCKHHAKSTTATLLHIDRLGLRLEQAGSTIVFVPWARFGKAYASRLHSHIRVMDRQGRRIPELDGIILGFLAGSCAEKMNELAQIYARLELAPGEPSNAQPRG